MRTMFLAGATALLTVSAAVRADAVLALGDSLGWGFDPTSPNAFDPSYGDHTWVSSWANALSGRLGSRPDVYNLSVPGEMAPTMVGGGAPAYSMNLHYDAENPGSQAAKLQQTLTGLRTGGERVEAVAIGFGGTDVLNLMANPFYLWGTRAEQDEYIAEMLTGFRAAYRTLLTTIQEESPGADIIMINAHNPANAYLYDDEEWNDDYAAPADYALRALNAEIAALAAEFDGRYVDIYSAFLGREHLLTHMADLEDPHPNAEGYAIIAGLVIPAPGALALFGAGGLALAGRRRR